MKNLAPPERDVPLSLRGTSRNKPHGEEFDRIVLEYPIRAAYQDGSADAGYTENLVPFPGRVQSIPPPAVCWQSYEEMFPSVGSVSIRWRGDRSHIGSKESRVQDYERHD
jgi:hypothetical protein